MQPAIRSLLFLDDQEVAHEMLIHPPAYTAHRLARYLRVAGRQVAKTVLLAGPGGYYVAVLPATHQADLAAVAQTVGHPVRLADQEEIAQLFNDCERGTLSPFGRLYGLSTLLDDSFQPSAMLDFKTQRHSLTIRMRCRDFVKVERPRRIRFAELPSAGSGNKLI